MLQTVEGHETAVALRQEIAAQQKKERRTWWVAWSRRRAAVWGTILFIAVVTTAILLYASAKRNGAEESEFSVADGVVCLQTAVPQLRVSAQNESDVVLLPDQLQNVPGEADELELTFGWPDGALSLACEEFVLADNSFGSTWTAEAGGIAANDRWTAVYQKLDPSVNEDKIIVSLLYNDQPFPYTYHLSFAP